MESRSLTFLGTVLSYQKAGMTHPPIKRPWHQRQNRNLNHVIMNHHLAILIGNDIRETSHLDVKIQRVAVMTLLVLRFLVKKGGKEGAEWDPAPPICKI